MFNSVCVCLILQAQLNELTASYKKAHKVELADEIDKKCSGDLKALILAKLGKGVEKNLSRSILSLYKCFMKLNFAESNKCRATIRHVSGDVVCFEKVKKLFTMNRLQNMLGFLQHSFQFFAYFLNIFFIEQRPQSTVFPRVSF